MNEKPVFYCFPRWTTCGKAKAWLLQKTEDFIYRDILKEPLTEEELIQLAQLKDIHPKELLNPRSTNFKKRKLKLEELTDKDAVNLLIQDPRMMYRPILSNGSKVVIGFREEEMEAILT